MKNGLVFTDLLSEKVLSLDIEDGCKSIKDLCGNGQEESADGLGNESSFRQPTAIS